MENKGSNPVRTIGVILLLVGIAILAYQFYDQRYVLFNLAKPRHASSSYYYGIEMRRYLNSTHSWGEFFMRVMNIWLGLVPTVVGFFMAVFGKSKES